MNYVQFTGKVAGVNAYTDGSHKVVVTPSWTSTDDYWAVTLVNEEWNELNWIEARFPKKQWGEFFRNYMPEYIKLLGVEGAIKTEISRGSGYVSNYIEVNRITVCLTK